MQAMLVSLWNFRPAGLAVVGTFPALGSAEETQRRELHTLIQRYH